MRTNSIFLQAVIVLLGIGALGLLLWEPHIEGRNAHATTFQIYLNDPFLAYAYIASLPFFVAVLKAFMVSKYVGQPKLFSLEVIKDLRVIKYCAIAMMGFVGVGEIFIMLGTSDDRAGGVFIGLLIFLGSVIMAFVAAMFERKVQKIINKESASFC